MSPLSAAIRPALVFVICAAIHSASAEDTTSKTFRAVESFEAVNESGFVPFYRETRAPDPAEHGLAVNTKLHEGQPAAAELVYDGPAGTFDLTLLAVAEEDGESIYALAINGAALPERTNPASTEKRRPARHLWQGITLAPGDRIRVIFRGHSNGRIPEGGGFARSRGRWRSLELSPAAAPAMRTGTGNSPSTDTAVRNIP